MVVALHHQHIPASHAAVSGDGARMIAIEILHLGEWNHFQFNFKPIPNRNKNHSVQQKSCTFSKNTLGRRIAG
jgi:hypothetical protein